MANYSNLKFNSDYKSKSLTLDGISFNHVIHLDTGHATLLGRGTWGTSNASGTLVDNNYAVNAVDINWNGATPGLGESSSTGITTTGELLKYIKQYATIKTQLGTTAIGSATKPIYWNGTSFVAANNYPSGVSTLTLTKEGTSSIDLSANTTYKLTVGDKSIAFKTPVDQNGGGGTTVTDGSNILAWNQNVTLATVGGVAIDAKLPTNPVTNDAIANLGFTKNTGTVTKVKVGTTEYSPSSGLITLPAYPTVTTYTQGTNISISSNTISHATPSGASSGQKGNKSTQLLAYITTDAQGHVTSYNTITPAELWSLLQSYADARYLTPTPAKVDPELSIGNPASTTLADGASTTITITSNVAGKLTIPNSPGYGWSASSNSATSAKTQHTVTVTNTTDISSAGSLSSLGVTFTPTDTTNYNTLTNVNVVKQTITLSAATPTKTLTSITVTGEGPAAGTIYSGGTNKKSTTWTKGTVKANWSDNTSTDITSSVTPTVSSTTTGVVTVSGTTITAVAAGIGTVKATYSYTYNGVTKSVETTANITVVARAIDSIAWVSTAEVTTTQGTLANLGNIKVTYNNTDTANIAYNASNVTLWTNSACTTAYTASAAAGNYTIYAKYGGKVTSSPKSVKVTSSTTYYYSAGDTVVTTSNYTTANNAHSVTSISQIPSSLDISSISRKEAYFVLPDGCTPIVKTSANLPVTILTVATVNSHTIYKTDGKIGSGSTCTISK